MSPPEEEDLPLSIATSDPASIDERVVSDLQRHHHGLSLLAEDLRVQYRSRESIKAIVKRIEEALREFGFVLCDYCRGWLLEIASVEGRHPDCAREKDMIDRANDAHEDRIDWLREWAFDNGMVG